MTYSSIAIGLALILLGGTPEICTANANETYHQAQNNSAIAMADVCKTEKAESEQAEFTSDKIPNTTTPAQNPAETKQPIPAQQKEGNSQQMTTSQQPNSGAINLEKFAPALKSKIANNPPTSQNGQTMIRLTAKTSDSGAQFKEYLRQHGGELGSCHGAIVTGTLPYGELPGLSQLPSITRIEGDTRLFPTAK